MKKVLSIECLTKSVENVCHPYLACNVNCPPDAGSCYPEGTCNPDVNDCSPDYGDGDCFPTGDDSDDKDW